MRPFPVPCLSPHLCCYLQQKRAERLTHAQYTVVSFGPVHEVLALSGHSQT